MEVKSDPKTYEEVRYTDIDVAYPGEPIRALTLENGKDTYTETDTFLQVTCANGEVISLRKARMHWYSVRPAVRRRVVAPKEKA